MEGTERRCFRALIPGQVEIHVYVLQTSMKHFHFEFRRLKLDFFLIIWSNENIALSIVTFLFYSLDSHNHFRTTMKISHYNYNHFSYYFLSGGQSTVFEQHQEAMG